MVYQQQLINAIQKHTSYGGRSNIESVAVLQMISITPLFLFRDHINTAGCIISMYGDAPSSIDMKTYSTTSSQLFKNSNMWAMMCYSSHGIVLPSTNCHSIYMESASIRSISTVIENSPVLLTISSKNKHPGRLTGCKTALKKPPNYYNCRTVKEYKCNMCA